MEIQYIGMFDEVIVPDLVDERGYPKPPIARGVAVEVPDDLAKRLLQQTDNWALQEKPRTGRGAHSEGIASSGAHAAEG